jgi:hypothetical protein
MLRTVVAVGLGLLIVAAGTLAAQQAKVETQPSQPASMRGEMVRVDPATGKVVIRVGTGAAAEEREFLVAPGARFLGPDEKVLVEGLRAREIRPGATVMIRLGPGTTGISEFRIMQLARGSQPQQEDFLRGEIVRVDPVTHKVRIRVGTGVAAEEREFLVAPKARFLGPEEKVLVEGMRHPEFRPGAHVMFRRGPRNTAISEFRIMRLPRRR